MKPIDIEKYEDIIEYIKDNTDDECSFAINGLNEYHHDMATEEQRQTIERWIEEWWDEVKEIYQEDYDSSTSVFDNIPSLSKFIYKGIVVCKVPVNNSFVGIDTIGRIYQIDKDYVVETYNC